MGERRAVFTDPPGNARAKLDRSGVRRCIPLQGEFQGDLRNRVPCGYAILPPIWNSESRSYGCRLRLMSAWSLAVMKRWSAIGLTTSHRAFVESNCEPLQGSQAMSALGQKRTLGHV